MNPAKALQARQTDVSATSEGRHEMVDFWAVSEQLPDKGAVRGLLNILLAAFGGAALLVIVLLILGVSFRRPLPAQGAALYNPSTEATLKGVVSEVQTFACPVSEGEMGSHLMLKTNDGRVLVHLAPGRVMRTQKLKFAPGDQITVTGSRVRVLSSNDLIAREITRAGEAYVLRDQTGKLMMVQ